jgi:uncharacterized damage-inducible protein DinB
MTSREREDLLRELDETRENLLRTVHGLSEDQLSYREERGRWSVAENLEHIAFTEHGILGLVTRALQKESTGLKSADFSAEDEALRKRLAESRKIGLQATESLQPAGRWPVSQLLPEFEAARKRTREFAAETEDDLRGRSFPHAQLGALDCYQWLVLIASHCDRHRGQIERVKASAGFPRQK